MLSFFFISMGLSLFFLLIAHSFINSVSLYFLSLIVYFLKFFLCFDVYLFHSRCLLQYIFRLELYCHIKITKLISKVVKSDSKTNIYLCQPQSLTDTICAPLLCISVCLAQWFSTGVSLHTRMRLRGPRGAAICYLLVLLMKLMNI